MQVCFFIYTYILTLNTLTIKNLIFISLLFLLSKADINESKNFNKKQFLLPDSHRSMSCYHARVMEYGIMKLTKHDCKHSIQFKNDLNNEVEIDEDIEKLSNLPEGIIELKLFVQVNFKIERIRINGNLT